MKIKHYHHKSGCLVCGCLLSRYNPDVNCSLHSGKATRSEIHQQMYLATAGEKQNFYQPAHSPRPVYHVTHFNPTRITLSA